MAHQHSGQVNVLDEANAAALITLKGLALFCFTERGGYEGGLLRLERHPFSLVVHNWKPQPYRVGGDGNITVEVVNPVGRRMNRFERGPFDRQLPGDNHPNDFRWIIDSENEEMHGRDLHESNPDRLRKLSLNSGVIYTRQLRPEEFVRVRFDKEDEPCQFFGRFAMCVGVAIDCRDEEGSGIRIRTEGKDGEEIFLPRRTGTRYEIVFDNGCEQGRAHAGTDFREYYSVMSDPRGVKYDFCLAANPGDPKARGLPCVGRVVKFRDGQGLACDNTYLRETSQLPS